MQKSAHHMELTYQRETVAAAEFADILNRSGLDERRPAGDLERLQRMLDGANLTITARTQGSGALVGIARSLTDWSYACYLSDLAVDRAFQGQGIGTKLIALTREFAGEECICLLLAAPDAVSFYKKIGMPASGRAFLYPRVR